jgi:oxygen-independent coproporphyrinogen-3 oxidase
MQPDTDLIRRWNTAAPRYTSYPTVPCWQHSPEEDEWKNEVRFTYSSLPENEGISLYIHLPYCESLCTYCGCNTRITINHAVEEPYVNAVLKEWEMYTQLFNTTPQIRELHLGGGTPTFFSAANLQTLLSGIFSKAVLHPNASLSFEAHPANTTVEHLETLYALGFRRLSLGIQDFDPLVQKTINRTQSFESVREVTEAARRIGYTSVNFDLIYGLPKQTLQSVRETFRLTNQLRPDRIAFYSYAHVPWIKPGQRSFTEADLPGNEQKLALYNCGRQMLEKAGYKEIGMDHFALPADELNKAAEEGSLHRNFMGYTTSPSRLLIGLGVSAISDSWLAYAQNFKTVEAYLEAVNNGRLPVFRGHLLNTEDVKMRRHILNIMCRYATHWPAGTHEQAFYQTIAERLAPHRHDGLVKLNPGALEVTPLGRAFLRNICMAFDERLYASEQEKVMFSKAV